MNLYSVYDSTGDEFFAPFQSRNDETALRSVDGSAPFPGYELYYVGKFSSESGEITPGKVRKIADIKVKENKENAV